jgi:Protein of unknown function (DUF2786)
MVSVCRREGGGNPRKGHGHAMPDNRERLQKVLAVAISPGAYETEAIAALTMARQLVSKHPHLAHLPDAPAPKPAPPEDASLEMRLKGVRPFWMKIALNLLSQQAYGLGLKSKLVCDFRETPNALDIRCDGPQEACDAFRRYVYFLIDHINAQPSRP